MMSTTFREIQKRHAAPLRFQPRGALPILGAATVLTFAGVLASLMPAARGSHVDVVEALRSE